MANRFDITLDDLLHRPSSSGRSAYRRAPFTNPTKFNKRSSSSLSDCENENCICRLFNKKIPGGNHGTAPDSSSRNKSKAEDESRRNTLKKYFKNRKFYSEKKISSDRLNCYSSNSTSSAENNFLPSRYTRLGSLKNVFAKDGVSYSDESITDQQCRQCGILSFESNSTRITRDELNFNEQAWISLKETEVNNDLSVEFHKEKSQENPPFSQEKHTTDYQQLLETDLDIFKTLLNNNNSDNNRNILDSLCSIHTNPDLSIPCERNDQPRKLLQLKYVREVDRSQSSIINHNQEQKQIPVAPIETQSYRKVTECNSSQEQFVCLHSRTLVKRKYKFPPIQFKERFISQKLSTSIEPQSQRNNSFEILDNGNREEEKQINDLPVDVEIDNINEDKTEAKKIIILEDITFNNVGQISPIIPVNRESDCNRKRIKRSSNSNTLDVDKEISKSPNHSKKHILKERFTQIFSMEDQKIGKLPAIDYETNVEYLKEFIEDKLQDITQYLYRYQSKLSDDTNDNHLNNIILSSLNDPVDENLLNRLQSQDIYSQSLTFTPVLVNRSDMKVSQTNTSQSLEFHGQSDEMLINSIDGLLNDKSLICQDVYDVEIPEDVKKMFILRSLSDFFMKLLDDIRNERIPILNIRSQMNWRNCVFDEYNLLLKPASDTSKSKVSLKSGKGPSKFNLILFLIGKISNLLISNSFCTKRELYYQLKDFVNTQSQINTAIDAISCLFSEPAWEFGVIATGKGLIYGDLTITFSEKQILNCNIQGGSLVPQHIHKIRKLESNASFILIVEKDSIFQKLLDEDLPNQLPRSFIMITGKGYADTNTCLLIKKLWQILYIPVFLLADADPHGIEIMLTYKFGSKARCHLSEHLALPSLRWIGLHPKEIISLNVARQPLTEKDRKLIRSLLHRPYIDSVPNIKEELEIMLANNFKAEIEGIMKSHNYLTNFYIPSKLCARDFL